LNASVVNDDDDDKFDYENYLKTKNKRIIKRNRKEPKSSLNASKIKAN